MRFPRPLEARAIALSALLAVGAVMRARAQCPDGAPPPCGPVAVVRAPPLEGVRRRSFVVLPFRNLSHDADHEWLVEASATMLADALGQWSEITVVPDERLYPSLRRHRLRAGDVMDFGSIGQVAAETGGWTAVTGEFLASTRGLRVNARAYDAVTRRPVGQATAEVPRAGDVRDAYDRVATALLQSAGLRGASADLAAATTGSLDAYRAYLRGLNHLHRSEFRRAREAFAAAVAIDSTFAQAYAKLAEVSLLALSVLEPGNPAYGYAERAAALAGRLPARTAREVRALQRLVSGDFTAARAALESLVAEDSNDVDALEALASLEFLDPLLVRSATGERRRGSLGATVQLAERVLGLDRARHGAYRGLVAVYSLAGGQAPAAVAGFRDDTPRPVRSSIREWCSCDFDVEDALAPADTALARAPSLQMARPDRVFVPLLRRVVELVPLESLALVPPESLETARGRARAVARVWVQRWLAVSPGEAEAHRAASRVHELDGDAAVALRELETADSLGVEAEVEAVAARRMILLAKLGRTADARGIADSLWQAGYFGRDFVLQVPVLTEAYAWATNLYAAFGDFAKARAALTAFSARLALRVDPLQARATTITVLSGAGGGPLRPVTFPAPFRDAVREALRAELQRSPGDELLGMWLRRLSATAAGP
jgi:tetratricopeptide (TPR) repeat protein